VRRVRLPWVATGGGRRGARAPVSPRAITLLIGAALAASWVGPAVADGANLTALVANSSGGVNFGNLTPVDIATNAVEAWSPLGGPNPVAIAFTPNGTSAWVANVVNSAEHSFLDQVLVEAKSGGATISTIYDPWAIAITPDGTTAYVVNRNPPVGGIVPVTLASATVGTEIKVADAIAVAITPDGSTGYVVSGFSGKGSVTPVELGTGTPGTAIPVGTNPRGIAITPDGATAYVLNTGDYSVTPIDLAEAKAKTAIAIPEVIYVGAIAIAPDGLTAYVAAQKSAGNADVLVPINLAEGKAGTAISEGVSNEPPTGIAISPDGTTAYVTHPEGKLVPINLAEGKAGAAINVKGGYETPETEAVAIQPDQAPVAAFSTTPAPPKAATKFNASASTSSVGKIASYEWEFGDSQKETTLTAETTHIYSVEGTYKAKLTVTDSLGTSTTKIYTGQMMLRDGGPSAVVEHSVVIGSFSSPKVKLNKESIPFGEVEVGQVKGPETIEVENSGSAELEIEPGGVHLEGADPSQFKLTEDGCSEHTIAPTHHCSFKVSFAPGAPGDVEAKVKVKDNANGSPQEVTLTGTGVAASAQLSATSLEFGQLAAGERSAVQMVRLTNGGAAPLKLAHGAVRLGGAQPAAFTISGDECSETELPPHVGTCTVSVAFAPSTASTTYSATLEFVDNAANSPQTVVLRGSTAAPPTPADVTASPAELQFVGAIGATSARQPVEVDNTGGTPAHVSAVALSGSAPSAFKILSDGCSGHAIEAYTGRCRVEVAFTPGSAGYFAATLQISSDAPGGAASVALHGATSGTITGKVINTSAGNAPVGAQIEAFCVDNNELCPGGRAACVAQITCRYVFTGADGSYTLADLVPGRWHIDVYPMTPGISSSSANVDIGGTTAGAVVNFELHSPRPLTGGVSFAGPGGEVESGVPTVYYNRPFSFKIPVHIGPGTPNATEVFLTVAALGNEGAAGGQGGGFNLASAALFSVHYNASGRPGTASQIMVGQLECGPPAESSPCGAFGTASADAAAAHATAARVPAGASLLQGGLLQGGLLQGGLAQGGSALGGLAQSGLAMGHAASCGGPPGFRNGTAFGFEINPTTNGGIQIEMSVVPLQPPVSFIFDPVGLAPWSPTGNPLINAEVEMGIGIINKLGSAVLPGLSAYNTLVKVLSSGLTAVENPTVGNVINAGFQTYVTQLNVEDHGAMYYLGSYGKGPIGKVLKEKSEGTVPGNTEGPLTGPGPGKPCEEKSGGAGPGGGGGSGGGEEQYGGEAYIDPSGLVQSSGHVPIAGATVTLTRAAIASGHQLPVANGSTLMSPGNRRNPGLTNLQGAFGWDVQPGYYQIDASRAGCRSPRGGSVSRSAVEPVPPPQLNLPLTLRCPRLRRNATHLRLKLLRGIDGTSVLRVFVSSSRRLRSRAGDYVGTILVRDGGRLLATRAPDPRSGLAVVDLPSLSGSSRSITVSFSGNGLLGPSRARAHLG